MRKIFIICSAVAPIIAVTENGTICAETLGVNGYVPGTTGYDESSVIWNEDCSDCCTMNTAPMKDAFISGLIEHGASSCSPKPAYTYATVTPMLKTKWQQGEWNECGVYNKYCLTPSRVYAVTGCSTIAMAQIMAYNARTEDYLINGVKLDYEMMTSLPYAESLTNNGQEQVSQLIGHIFNHCSRINFFSAGTAISASSIKNFLNKYAIGYSNIQMCADNCFNKTMIQATSDMLEEGKPVYVTAFTKSLFTAHSWVVDGARYASSGNYRGTYMLHCNWGWHGAYNGYFSISNLTPSDSDADFDDSASYYYGEKDQYTQLFRVITYDLD